jgi:hypothetical protein
MGTAYFAFGASGSGKTSAVRELERAHRAGLKTFFFDSIGVPSEQERIEGWGSGGGWQRAMTIEWVRRMRCELASSNVLLMVRPGLHSSLKPAKSMMSGLAN